MDRHRQPALAVDCIVRIDSRVVLVRRKNEPHGWALPGGFVDYGESLEDAVRRELREETGLELDGLQQFHSYSDPSRDPRGHCVSVVFTGRGIGEPRAGDDAAACRLVDPGAIAESETAFDHARILRDYAAGRYGRQA